MDLARIVAEQEGTRARVAGAVAGVADEVVALARQVHANPELAFVEVDAAAAATAWLEARGFAVERGIGRLPTAFRASAGSGDLRVGVCVEYDALPGVGHACGHNLILGAGLLAAVGLQAVAGELGLTVLVIGTPAEEHGGGKVYLLQDGAFDDVDLAIMVHPVGDGFDTRPAGTTSQAVGRWRATYTGKASHAAFAPHLGVNAADAVTVAQVAVGLLRQQIPGDHRTNMVVTEAGDVTNIIPARAVVEFEARAFTLGEFEALVERVTRCFEAGALATGCELSIEAVEPVYEPLLHDEVLSKHWCDAYGTLGRNVEPGARIGGGSTDFGNVSQILPGLHPWVSIPGVAASIHSDEFAAAANSKAGYDTMLTSGLAMAWAVAGLAADVDDRAAIVARREGRRVVERGTVPGEADMLERLEEAGIRPAG